MFNFNKVASYEATGMISSMRYFASITDSSTGHDIVAISGYTQSGGSTTTGQHFTVYKDVIANENWVMAGDTSLNGLFGLNGNFITASSTSSNPGLIIKYCTGMPSSSSSFKIINVPSEYYFDQQYWNFVYYNSKYYTPIRKYSEGVGHWYLLEYITLNAVPTVIDLGVESSRSDVGTITIIDDKLCMQYNYTNTSQSYVLVDKNKNVTTFTTGAYSSTIRPRLIYKLGTNYYHVGQQRGSGSGVYDTAYLDVYKSTSLTAIPNQIYYVEYNNSRYNGNMNDTGTIQTEDAILLQNGNYIDVNGNIVTYKKSPTLPIARFGKTDLKVYTTSSSGFPVYSSIYGSSQFDLPAWTPADGLYAYIKAKR